MTELPLDTEYQILEYLYDRTTMAMQDKDDATRLAKSPEKGMVRTRETAEAIARAVLEVLCGVTVHVQDIIAERPLTTSTDQRIEKLKELLAERRQ